MPMGTGIMSHTCAVQTSESTAAGLKNPRLGGIIRCPGADRTSSFRTEPTCSFAPVRGRPDG